MVCKDNLLLEFVSICIFAKEKTNKNWQMCATFRVFMEILWRYQIRHLSTSNKCWLRYMLFHLSKRVFSQKIHRNLCSELFLKAFDVTNDGISP